MTESRLISTLILTTIFTYVSHLCIHRDIDPFGFCVFGPFTMLILKDISATSPSKMEEFEMPIMTSEQALELLVAVDREPVVITNKLIQEAIQQKEQRFLSQKEIKKIEKTDKGPVKLQEIKELSLEFYNILRIDHLWMCSNLKILSLSNNIIEKIENLDDLVNLVELNLSFNRISRIKNLSKLVNLERLSLFNNRIKKLKNISGLKKLQILSLGQNEIADAKYILRYLRLFKNLRSLNLEGNPCEKEIKNMRLAVAGFIPQLVYYNYFILKQEEREIARKRYKIVLELLEKNEAKKEAEDDEEQKKIERANYLKKACIDGFERSDFYEYLMENDNEGKTLIKISDRVREVFHKFKEALNTISKRLFSVGEKQYGLRMDELNRYGTYYKESMIDSLTESRALIRDFINDKSKYIKEIVALYNDSNGDETLVRASMKKVLIIDKDFAFLRRKTWWLLMEKEMKRYEKNESSMAIFDTNITEMIHRFIDFVQEEFARMRDTETEFCDGLSDQINRYIAEFQSKGDSPVSLPFFLRSILLNKETLNNHIATSHDNHLLLIDNKEEEILEKLRTWLKILLTDLIQCEINRNREAVLEIQQFMDHHTLDWAEQVKTYVKDALTYMTKAEPKWTNEIMRLKMNKKERTLDDKMQMLLKQRNEFDRKERIRRDKIRRKKKQSKSTTDKEFRSTIPMSEAESNESDAIAYSERQRALINYKKVFQEMDNVIKNMMDFDMDYSDKFEREIFPSENQVPIKRSLSYFTSRETIPLPIEPEKPQLTDQELYEKMRKITQSFKAKYTPEEEELEEIEPEKEPRDEEDAWSEGSAILVEDDIDIEAFQNEVTRNVSRFVNNAKIRADHMAQTLWEMWSSPEPQISDSESSESDLSETC